MSNKKTIYPVLLTQKELSKRKIMPAIIPNNLCLLFPYKEPLSPEPPAQAIRGAIKPETAIEIDVLKNAEIPLTKAKII